MLVVGIPSRICKEAVSLFSQELQQHDVQELNRILFAAIESSLMGTSGEHLIGQLYRGTAVQQVNHSQSQMQWNPSIRTPLKYGYLSKQDTSSPSTMFVYFSTPEIGTPL